jgi:photosystem II stability/assembly factor-like uncharacterized protein
MVLSELMLPKRLTAMVLLLLVAGCNGNVPAGAQGGRGDGGVPDSGPARACLPVTPPPGEWQPVQGRGPNSFGTIMVVDDALFVVDDSFERLLRSDDRGATWCRVPTPVRVLALFADARALYVIPDDSALPDSPSDTPPPRPRPPGLQPTPPSRVLRSDDGGDNWRDPGGMLPHQPSQLLPWSSDPQQLVAIFPAPPPPIKSELWLTLDGGGEWHPIKPAGPAPADPLDWRWIQRHPADPSTLVALAVMLTPDETTPDPNAMVPTAWLWTSKDEGLTWNRLTNDGPYQDAVLNADATVLALTNRGDVVSGGLDARPWTTLSHLALLRSTFLDGGPGKLFVQGLREERVGPISTLETSDGGRSWTTVYDEYMQRMPLRWWPGTALELSGYGLRASDDGGSTWRTLLASTSYTNFSSGGGTRFLTNDIALLRASDDTGEWMGTPFFDRRLISFFPHPTATATAYAVTATRGPGGERSLVRTSDGGKSWQAFSISADGQPVANASIVAAAASTPPALFVAGDGPPLRSIDGGQTWSRLMLPPTTVIRPAPSDPTLVYATNGPFFAVSKDAGLTWTLSALPNPSPADATELIVDPLDSQTLYLLQSGLYRSTDGGLHWTRLLIFPAKLAPSMALSPARPGTLFYVDAATGYVVETPDGGMTKRWHRPPGVVSGLAFDQAHPEVLYLTTSAGAFQQVLP